MFKKMLGKLVNKLGEGVENETRYYYWEVTSKMINGRMEYLDEDPNPTAINFTEQKIRLYKGERLKKLLKAQVDDKYRDYHKAFHNSNVLFDVAEIIEEDNGTKRYYCKRRDNQQVCRFSKYEDCVHLAFNYDRNMERFLEGISYHKEESKEISYNR